MKTIDHLLLGRYLLLSPNVQMTKYEKKAFLFGCVEPDYNPLTRVKGTGPKDLFYGHNAEVAGRFIKRNLVKLNAMEQSSVYRCFMLGSLLHYLADAFTYVHNGSLFTGTLEEHCAYEMELHNYLLDMLESRSVRMYSSTSVPLDAYFAENHAEYRTLPQAVETDVEYITRVSEVTLQCILCSWKTADFCQPLFA